MALNPWAILGALLTVLALCAASFGFGHHVEYLALVAYQKSQTTAAEKQVADNKSALLAQQQADAAAMAQINQTHGVQLNAITQRRDALLAANRNLSQRLWVRTASADKPATGVSKTGSGGSVATDSGEVELPQQLASWLVDQFTQADNDAALVTSLQQVVIHDRLVCNGSLPGVTKAAGEAK